MYKLAYGIAVLRLQHAHMLQSVSVILEGDSQPNVLRLVRALLAAPDAAHELAQKLYFMDRECLRGNARRLYIYIYIYIYILYCKLNRLMYVSRVSSVSRWVASWI